VPAVPGQQRGGFVRPPAHPGARPPGRWPTRALAHPGAGPPAAACRRVIEEARRSPFNTHKLASSGQGGMEIDVGAATAAGCCPSNLPPIPSSPAPPHQPPVSASTPSVRQHPPDSFKPPPPDVPQRAVTTPVHAWACRARTPSRRSLMQPSVSRCAPARPPQLRWCSTCRSSAASKHSTR